MIHRWNDILVEPLGTHITRQMIHTERLTVARLTIAAGGVVPRHEHENEQVTLLERGRLRFVFDDGAQEIAAGEAMQIASHVPHRVEALEDSVVVDLFAPVREDWRRGDDAYLRR